MIPSGVAALVLLSAVAAPAQPPTVTVEPLACIPGQANGLVTATVEPPVADSLVRLYFRRAEQGDFYFTAMVPAGGGRYWGLTARPAAPTERVEYYVEVVDAGAASDERPCGRAVARSQPLLVAPVRDDCPNPLLAPEGGLARAQQFGAANNLTVGETAQSQEGTALSGFLCDGVVTRLNHACIARPDEVCRGCVVPWWLDRDPGR